jgi:hypothetical protein
VPISISLFPLYFREIEIWPPAAATRPRTWRIVVLSAGIRVPPSESRRSGPESASRGTPPPGEIIPEWWATSSRNGGRDHLGIRGRHHLGTTGGFIRNRQAAYHEACKRVASGEDQPAAGHARLGAELGGVGADLVPPRLNKVARPFRSRSASLTHTSPISRKRAMTSGESATRARRAHSTAWRSQYRK